MAKIIGMTLMTMLFLANAYAETKRFINSSASKIAVSFPETVPGQIAIQTGAGTYEILAFTEEDGHAIAQSCERESGKPCKAQDLKSFFNKTQKELSERCNKAEGESRIARRHGVRKITSVCYFKEDKSFVEFN